MRVFANFGKVFFERGFVGGFFRGDFFLAMRESRSAIATSQANERKRTFNGSMLTI